MKEKVYKLQVYHTRRGEKIIEDTLEGLKSYFGYTLEIGRSWNNKIKHLSQIKTIKSFVTNLQKSYEEKEGACYERTFVKLVK